MKITLPLSLPCGCRLSDGGMTWNFDRCPLHDAAPELLDALCGALVYVEDALDDPAFKPGVVLKEAKKIRALIAKVEGK